MSDYEDFEARQREIGRLRYEGRLIKREADEEFHPVVMWVSAVITAGIASGPLGLVIFAVAMIFGVVYGTWSLVRRVRQFISR